jgi:hypothetical protein
LPFPETYAKDRACLLVKNVRVRISLDYRLVNSRVTDGHGNRPVESEILMENLGYSDDGSRVSTSE